jgi:hypothetical protein
MKNITLSADEHLIEKAREVARSKRTTLNQEFRTWLESYARPNDVAAQYRDLMKRLNYVKVGRKFTRDEMNER